MGRTNESFCDEKGAADDADDEFLSSEAVRAAEDAVVEMRGKARFLTAESSPHADELLRFYEVVAPLVDYYWVGTRPGSPCALREGGALPPLLDFGPIRVV